MIRVSTIKLCTEEKRFFKNWILFVQHFCGEHVNKTMIFLVARSIHYVQYIYKWIFYYRNKVMVCLSLFYWRSHSEFSKKSFVPCMNQFSYAIFAIICVITIPENYQGPIKAATLNIFFSSWRRVLKLLCWIGTLFCKEMADYRWIIRR